jgi:hypothetical protein
MSKHHKQIKKKVMKKIFLSLMLIAGLSLGIYASPARGEGHRGGKLRGMKELNLSQEQQEQLKSIHKDFASKFKDLREDNSISKEVKQEKVKELVAAKQDRVKGILTPEQQSKWEKSKEQRTKFTQKDGRKKFRKEHRSHAYKGERNNHRKGKDRMASLDLNTDQKIKIDALDKDFKEKAQALKNEQALSKEAKREKYKELAKAHKAEVSSILTAEQKAKMKDRSFSSKDRNYKGHRANLSEEARAELKSLKDNFIKEKKAVELSRIAPDMQKQRIKELREKYRTERRKIVGEELKKKG